MLLAAPMAVAAPDPEITAAWGGWSRPERTTWLDLRLLSPLAGTAEIRVESGPETTRATLALQPDTPARLGLPVRARGGTTITLRWPDGTVTSHPAPVDLAEQPLVAWAAAADPPAHSAWPAAHVVALDAPALPPFTAAYDAVDALVLDGRTVSSLTQPQLGGLLGYLARCGQAVFVALPAPARRIVQDAAGCGGDGLSFVELPAQVLHGLETLQAATPSPGPPGAAAIGMLPSSPGTWRRATLLVAAYLGIVLWITLFAQRPAWLVGAILGGTAAAWLVVRLAGSETSLGVWSEMRAGERVARYYARETLGGTVVGFAMADLPQFLDEPTTCTVDTPAEWQWDGVAGRFASVRLPTALFRAEAICFRGHFPILRSARLDAAGAGSMRLTNAGDSAWPAGWVSLLGEVHVAPPLAPGQSIEIDRERGAAAASGIQRLAIERAGPGHEGLLLPLAVPADAQGIDESRAWLLLRIPRVAGGDT